MRQNRLILFSVLALSFVLAAPSVLHAEDSYIDQLARQVQQDIESGAVKDKVKAVDTTTQTPPATTTPAPQTPSRSTEDQWLDQLHLARFFGTLLGPDEFATDEFWEDDLDPTGSYTFGDGVRNPTVLDLFGSGSGRVLGSDTDFIRPWSINDNTLRDAINSNDLSQIGQRLGELGYRTENFRIEYQ